MSRTNIDIDDVLVTTVMRSYGVRTKNVRLTLATTEPVRMERLAGAASGPQTAAAEILMLSQHWL